MHQEQFVAYKMPPPFSDHGRKKTGKAGGFRRCRAGGLKAGLSTMMMMMMTTSLHSRHHGRTGLPTRATSSVSAMQLRETSLPDSQTEPPWSAVMKAFPPIFVSFLACGSKEERPYHLPAGENLNGCTCHQIIWRKNDKCPKESPGMLYVNLR